MKRGLTLWCCWLLFLAFPLQADGGAGRRPASLLRSSADLAEESYDHFRDGTVRSTIKSRPSFSAREFSASARLFLKLAQDRGGIATIPRTNLFNAFSYLISSFEEL